MRTHTAFALLLTAMGMLLTLMVSAGPRLFSVPAGSVRGEPTIEEGKQTGIFVWYDRQGLHLRWTTDGKPALFTGRLDLDKPVGELKRVRDEYLDRYYKAVSTAD